MLDKKVSKLQENMFDKKEETDLLREKFVNEYSKNKGWNSKELSTNH